MIIKKHLLKAILFSILSGLSYMSIAAGMQMMECTQNPRFDGSTPPFKFGIAIFDYKPTKYKAVLASDNFYYGATLADDAAGTVSGATIVNGEMTELTGSNQNPNNASDIREWSIKRQGKVAWVVEGYNIHTFSKDYTSPQGTYVKGYHGYVNISGTYMCGKPKDCIDPNKPGTCVAS